MKNFGFGFRLIYWALLLVLAAFAALFGVVLVWGGVGVSFTLVMLLVTHAAWPWAILGLVFGPFVAVLFAMYVTDSIHTERRVVDIYGEHTALWVNYEGRHGGFSSPYREVFRLVVLRGHDNSGEWLSAFARTLKLPEELQEMIGHGLAHTGSVLWSRFIVWLDDHLDNSIGLGFVGLWLFLLPKFMLKVQFRILVWYWKLIMLALVLAWYIPPALMFECAFKCFMFVARFAANWHAASTLFIEWAKWRFTYLVVLISARLHALNSEIERRHSATISGGSRKLVTHYKAAIMQATKFINDLALPSFIRSKGWMQPTKERLQESLDILRAAGWPVNVDITDEVVPVEGLESFKEWVLCGSDFRTGIHNMKVWIDHDLDSLRVSGLNYRRTEEYATEKNELETTARYFKSPEYDFPDLALDDVWYVVKDIFQHSHLVPFNYIIQMWEKKYALGSFMKDPLRNKKYRRSDFISDIGGYGPFKKMWATTFYWASRILPVSAVSVKGEALPERKWAQDKLRTVIGSPISQYILSTIWNYGPNHRFAWESTPIKIGMPLNGYWMTSIWQRHSRCQVHVEGDFTAFDSTLSGKILDLIKAVRKKGYEFHKDRDRIADLIDINYDQVLHQLLNTTTTGNVYKKGTGLTTGHSSTSMDNSVALVTIYLMAWKDLTGLSAKEFLHFNELSCFGDDHMLSFLSTKPAVWNPKNIRNCMARWGLTNNLEVKPLTEMSFLSKYARRATTAEVADLAKRGLGHVRFLVWHDRTKLLGKLTSPIKNANTTYRLKRYLSYLTLTAHHVDIYNGLVAVINGSNSMKIHMSHNKLKVPSYDEILRNWYNPGPGQPLPGGIDGEIEEFENHGTLVQYGATSPLDAVIGALSMAPDFLNPVFFNYGYARALQVFLKHRLAWVVDLISQSNDIFTPGSLKYALKKTPYRWLDSSLHVPGLSCTNMSSMLVRHWLFLLYKSFRPVPRYAPAFNMVIRKISSFQFMLNAKLLGENKESEFQVDEILIVSLLSFIEIPDFLSFVGNIQFPDLQLLVDLIFHFVTVTIWSRVPASFKETSAALKNLESFPKPVGIKAPTGSGKSTSFVQHMFNTLGHKCDKLIVVVPRAMLATGLATFMQNNFGLPVTSGTRHSEWDNNAKVAYVTPQYLLSRFDLVNKKNVLVLDEAHINEPFYVLLRRVLPVMGVRTVYMSATLEGPIIDQCSVIIDIEMAKLWDVNYQYIHIKDLQDVNTSSILRNYENYVREVADSIAPGDRALIFVPTKAMAKNLADGCSWPAMALTSDSPDIVVWDKSVYFATPVADVGITVPNVNLVVSPNFTTLGSTGNGLLKLNSLVRTQRAGRTGRTNNGVYREIVYPSSALVDEPVVNLDGATLRNMLFEGLPFEIAAKMDIAATLKAIGLSQEEVAGVGEEDLIKSVSMFLKNMKPLIQAELASQETTGESYGPDYKLLPAYTGNFTVAPLNNPDAINDVVETIKEILRAKANNRPPNLQLESLRRLDRKGGPIAKVVMLVKNLINGDYDINNLMLNPNNRRPTGALADLASLVNIGKMLHEVSQMP